MLIARFIKPGSDLFKKIGAQLEILDGLFSVRPVWLLPIWILMTAGMGAAKNLTAPEFYWSTTVDWSVFYLFLGVSVLTVAALMNDGAERPGGSSRVVLIAGAVVTALTVSYMATTIQGGVWIVLLWVLIAFFSLPAYFSQREGGEPTLSIRKFLLTAVASLSLFMIGWQIMSEDILAGLISAVPYLLGSQAVLILLPALDSAEDADHFRQTVDSVLGVLALGTLLITLRQPGGIYWTILSPVQGE